MPEQDVRSYRRNGRVVRAYRRRGRVGRGSTNPQRPGVGEVPIPSLKDLRHAFGGIMSDWYRERGVTDTDAKVDELLDNVQLALLTSHSMDYLLGRDQIGLQGDLNSLFALQQIMSNFAVATNPLNNDARNTVNRVLDGLAEGMAQVRRHARILGFKLRSPSRLRGVRKVLRDNGVSIDDWRTDAINRTKRSVGKAVDVANPFD